MKIAVNRDLEEAYKDEFIKGFTLREAGFIAAGFLLGGGAAFLCWHYLHLPPEYACYIGIPAGIPAVVCGFKKFQGLTAGEYLKEILYERKTRVLAYDTGSQPRQEPYRMQHSRRRSGKEGMTGKQQKEERA